MPQALSHQVPGSGTFQIAVARALSVISNEPYLIIWHHALPHGSSPNHATQPRVVQYIKMTPSQWGYNPIWL